MTAQPSTRFISALKSVSRAAGATAILVGCVVLVGWMLDIAVLKSISPAWVTMKANTAFAFLTAGLSLWLLQTKQATPGTKRIAQVCALIVALVGLFTFSEYLFGWDLGIDQLLFTESLGSVGTFSPGRMAPTTALCFLMLGVALLLNSRGSHWPAHLLTLAAALLSLMAFLGYLYGAKSLYGIAAYTQMAVHTALTFLVCCVGVLFVRPDRGLMEMVTSDSVGGVMARRLLPITIGLPTVLGWLRFEGQRAGLYETEFGLSLMVVSSIVTLALVIWWTARPLDRMDAERKRAEEERFEQIVALSEALRKLDITQPTEGFFRDLVEVVRRAVGARYAALGILGPDGQMTQFIPVGLTQEEVARIGPLPRGVGLLGHMLRTPGPLRLEDFSSHSASSGFPPHHPSMRSFLGMRIVFQDRVIGALYLTEKEGGGPFTMADERLLEAFATNAAVAIANARAYQEVQEARRELEEKTRELEAFTYTVSHDLKAPLRGIHGFSRALEEDYGDRLEAQGRRHLEMIRISTRRMDELIDDLLKYSRLERRAMRRNRVDLSALCARVLEDRRPQIEASQLTIRLHLAVREVEAEPEGVREAIANLVDNAIKFNKPGGGITVSTEVVDHLPTPGTRVETGTVVMNVPGSTTNAAHLLVSVQDEGIGFDMRYHDRIFEIFQRLHRAEEYEGTGVGLAIVKKVAERHSGRAWATSELGKGSRFYLAIPIREGGEK